MNPVYSGFSEDAGFVHKCACCRPNWTLHLSQIYTYIKFEQHSLWSVLKIIFHIFNTKDFPLNTCSRNPMRACASRFTCSHMCHTRWICRMYYIYDATPYSADLQRIVFHPLYSRAPRTHICTHPTSIHTINTYTHKKKTYRVCIRIYLCAASNIRKKPINMDKVDFVYS